MSHHVQALGFQASLKYRAIKHNWPEQATGHGIVSNPTLACVKETFWGENCSLLHTFLFVVAKALKSHFALMVLFSAWGPGCNIFLYDAPGIDDRQIIRDYL